MRRTNRLAGQSSPYLLQHQHNPVDWWPWCQDAFAEARRRDVPIFLSIGYSTCYWCHVMERESFESEQTAAVMNERFVCVKVDREERPDVDELYMTATQLMSGHGGWPMSVFLEPRTLRPFFCGTYYPPRAMHGRPSFVQVLEGIWGAWQDRRGDVEAQARELAQAVREHASAEEVGPGEGGAARGVGHPMRLGVSDVERTASELLRIADPENGGFGPAPKFPQPVFAELLLDVREVASNEATRGALDVAIRRTLDAMVLGGIHDHVGGGFHRYAVDATWTVPHFEKMLYDQAQLALLLGRASRVFGDRLYADAARSVCGFVLREMTGPDGAFFSAVDAEVAGREGRNYVWTLAEVREALGSEAELAIVAFGLERGPNFRDPHHPDEPARSVLRMDARPEALAVRLGTSVDAVLAGLAKAKERLLEVRDRRDRPALDDKVIAAWNGMMARAMVGCGRLLGDGRLVDAGRRALETLVRTMVVEGELMRARRGASPARIPGLLEDYAEVVHALAELGDAAHVREAGRLAERAIGLFGEQEGAGWPLVMFDAREGQTDLFVRPRSTSDGATSSGSSAMVHALLALSRADPVRGDRWLELACDALRAMEGPIRQHPRACTNAVRAVLAVARDRRVLERWPGLLAGSGERARVLGSSGGVSVWSDAERIDVGVDRPASFRLRLRVPEGLHIGAVRPGGEHVRATRVVPIALAGLRAYVDGPEGEALVVPGASEGVAAEARVYHGEVELEVMVEQVGPVEGRARLGLEYQACSDAMCYEMSMVELDVAITAESVDSAKRHTGAP